MKDLLVLPTLLTLLAAASINASAADLVWNGTDGTWSTSDLNWLDDSSNATGWINGNTANFGSTVGGAVSIASGITADGVTIEAGSWVFTGSTVGGANGLNIATGAELTLNGAGMTYTGDTTVNGTLKLGALSSGLAFRAGSTLVINGKVETYRDNTFHTTSSNINIILNTGAVLEQQSGRLFRVS
jgi:hypothetical protein